jgi:RNA polymerase sigma factor (sigma-70 family)
MVNYKQKSDEDLILDIKSQKCNLSLCELVDRHSGLCFSIGKKFMTNCGLRLEDINDNKYLIIFNAANSFDVEKGSKFSTWLGNQVKFFCLNFKNKNNKLLPTEDKTLEFLINECSKNKQDNQKEFIENIRDLFHKISDVNTKNAIYYRYFYNQERILNYSEIAKILKVTPQTVLNWHNKFIKYAKKKLTNVESIDTI